MLGLFTLQPRNEKSPRLSTRAFLRGMLLYLLVVLSRNGAVVPVVTVMFPRAVMV